MPFDGAALAEQVADQIAKMIQECGIEPGEKLPNEFELMEQLQVGRGTVREAVKLLVARNVLEIQRGRGTFVANHTGITDDPLGFAFRTDKKALALDLYEIKLWNVFAAGTRAWGKWTVRQTGRKISAEKSGIGGLAARNGGDESYGEL